MLLEELQAMGLQTLKKGMTRRLQQQTLSSEEQPMLSNYGMSESWGP